MITITEYVPVEKFRQFNEILCATGGRYLRNPIRLFKSVEVCYEPGDYVAHCEAWTRCIKQIREVKRDQWLRIAMRRFGILV